ncbi:MAG: preprotein translocase subunit Sec61beta [Candidatus Woesearchaeota archaeon]|jgi:preprotein translocase subunit Sec61beta|nr:preprotein translocase subunit Sec61beta [Candidatus Woesearchaeota archaeon]MDP7324043.1 preprotein translocase subunit Sec61beta [Candidatus Woesearchaeota archaeon]MDP7457392.1 preprotein translocase subunit Sec61beta [Candidatus Woesearchaeota archaeon]
MANDRITMPTSTAGITRYFDDYKSKIEFKPGHIIVLTILVIIVIILLHIYGKSLLGA